MADFAIAVNFQGDYGYKVCFVDDEDTIAAAIDKIKDQIAGVLVAPVEAGARLEMRVQGAPAPVPADVMVKQSGLMAMESVEIYRAG